MSRLGKTPLAIPTGVTVTQSGKLITVKGPKGSLTQAVPPGIFVELKDGQLVARPERDDKALGKFHGLARSLVANAVAGVTDGFKRERASQTMPVRACVIYIKADWAEF